MNAPIQRLSLIFKKNARLHPYELIYTYIADQRVEDANVNM